MNKSLFFLWLLAMPFLSASAQTDSLSRSRSHMLAIGATNILDTYLSSEKYHGVDARYIYHSTRPTHWKNISQTVIHQGELSFVNNRADNNDEIGGMYNFQYHLRYNWWLCERKLQLEAGAGIDVNLGFLYNTRNSNNPAQARASVNLAPSVAASYRSHIKTMPFVVRYEAMAPLVGLMFSPNYGQSYYEIFNEGNYDHNIVPTTIGCTPSLRQLLSFDFKPTRKWSRTWLRIGYLGDYQQAKVNNLKFHQYSHLFIIGVTKML